MDYCFPLDTSYQFSDNDHRANFAVFFSFEEFKRISKIEIAGDEKLFSYELEEKYPTKQIWKSYHTIDTLKVFLAGISDVKAYELIILIDSVICKIESGWMMSQTLKDQEPNQQQRSKDRTYLMKLNESALSKIKRLPMIMIVETFDLSFAIGTYKFINHNYEFAKLIGYPDYLPTYSDIYNGFHIYTFVYTKNWINYYVKLFKAFMLNTQYTVWKSDELKIKDRNGVDIPGYFEYFRQTYTENHELFEEHYTIFHKYEETDK